MSSLDLVIAITTALQNWDGTPDQAASKLGEAIMAIRQYKIDNGWPVEIEEPAESAPAPREELLKASEVHLRAVQRACEILDAIPFNKSIADLRWAGRRLYIECKRLAARPQPKSAKDAKDLADKLSNLPSWCGVESCEECRGYRDSAAALIQSTFERWYNERWQEEHRAMKSPPTE